jgi:hypothetical protein
VRSDDVIDKLLGSIQAGPEVSMDPAMAGRVFK